MRLPAVLSLLIVLALASSIQAAPLLSFVSGNEPPNFTFGMENIYAELIVEQSPQFPGDPRLFNLSHLTFASGPLRDVTMLDGFETLYRYRPGGNLRWDLSWDTPTGAETGWLTARFPSLDALIREVNSEDPDRQPPDYPKVRYFDAIATHGLLSPSVVAYLGVSRHLDPIDMSFWLENIQGEPPTDDRLAVHIVTSFISVPTRDVPEASGVQLALTAVIGALSWRGRRRRR